MENKNNLGSEKRESNNYSTNEEKTNFNNINIVENNEEKAKSEDDVFDIKNDKKLKEEIETKFNDTVKVEGLSYEYFENLGIISEENDNNFYLKVLTEANNNI